MGPITYNEISAEEYFNLQPTAVKGSANIATLKAERYLWNLIYSEFEFEIPKAWSLGWFRFWLFHSGVIGVSYTGRQGDLAYICGPFAVDKIDYQCRPLTAKMTNTQLTKDVNCIRGVNFDYIYILDDYFGLWDLVREYAEKLAQIDKAININLMNCNVSKAFPAENKKEADTIKEAYGRATAGEPFIPINKKYFEEDGASKIVNLLGDVKSDYIAGDLQTLKRTIINEFLTKVGIRNANYDKKERLNSQEVSENNDETKALVMIMYDNIKSCIENIRKFADIPLSVKLRYSYEEGGESNAQSDNNRDR